MIASQATRLAPGHWHWRMLTATDSWIWLLADECFPGGIPKRRLRGSTGATVRDLSWTKPTARLSKRLEGSAGQLGVILMETDCRNCFSRASGDRSKYFVIIKANWCHGMPQ